MQPGLPLQFSSRGMILAHGESEATERPRLVVGFCKCTRGDPVLMAYSREVTTIMQLVLSPHSTHENFHKNTHITGQTRQLPTCKSGKGLAEQSLPRKHPTSQQDAQVLVQQ